MIKYGDGKNVAKSMPSVEREGSHSIQFRIEERFIIIIILSIQIVIQKSKHERDL